MAKTPDYENLTETRALPNSVELLGVVNTNLVRNVRLGAASRVALLSTWRLAKLVVTEAAPLLLYDYPVKP